MKPLYTAKATTVGGRDGNVKSEDGVIDMHLEVPSEMGGKGGSHTNPEQLFAAGYSACFGSALDMVMKMDKVDYESSSITAEVTIGKGEDNSYDLAVKLVGEIKGVDKEKAQELMEKAHQVCPYSRATRGNIDVTVDVK